MAAQPASHQYETSIDRVGLAIGAGGLMGGAIGVLLMLFAGTYDIGALLTAMLVGSLMTALSITALAAIPWALLHASGRRGPIAAAALGAAIGFVLFLGGQTYGFGAFAAPAIDARHVALSLGERVPDQPGHGRDRRRHRGGDVAGGLSEGELT